MIPTLLQNAAETWIPTGTTQTYGIFVGAFGGAAAGVVGAMSGLLAPRGKARGLVLGGMYTFFVFGLLNLAFGLVALIGGQPYAVWYPFLLVGGVFSLVMGGVIPSVKRVYRQAEQRRLEAAELRTG